MVYYTKEKNSLQKSKINSRHLHQSKTQMKPLDCHLDIIHHKIMLPTQNARNPTVHHHTV